MKTCDRKKQKVHSGDLLCLAFSTRSRCSSTFASIRMFNPNPEGSPSWGDRTGWLSHRIWSRVQCWNEGLALELLWVCAGAVALHNCKLAVCTGGRSCWQLLGGIDPDAGTCRKARELGGSPALQLLCPLLVAQACKAPMYRASLVFHKYWAPSEQRAPATSRGRNICLKRISLAVGNTRKWWHSTQPCTGLLWALKQTEHQPLKGKIHVVKTHWYSAQGFSASCAWKHLHDHAFKTETYYTMTTEMGYKIMFSLQRAGLTDPLQWCFSFTGHVPWLNLQCAASDAKPATECSQCGVARKARKAKSHGKKGGLFLWPEGLWCRWLTEGPEHSQLLYLHSSDGFTGGWGRSASSAYSLEMRFLQ